MQTRIQNEVAQIFYPTRGKVLIWNGFKTVGKQTIKNQYWKNEDINWELHLSGHLKQGGA